MVEGVSLTIGIPTYNRRDAVLERIKELFAKPLPRNVSVLVIDNHSTDGTFEKLLEESEKYDRLRVLKNDTNHGYAGNFFRLFEEVETGYLLLDSDEDEVLVERIADFLRFLRKNAPSFVSPQAVVFDRVYRGSGKTGQIEPEDFRNASNYLSGITFDVTAVRDVCVKVQGVVQENAAVHVYPQVLVAAEALCIGRCFWYPEPITVKRQQLRSHIENPDGGAYYHLIGRYQQNIGFIDYLTNMVGTASFDDTALKIVEQMLRTARGWIFHNLRGSLGREHPELLREFDQSGRKFYSPFRRYYSFLRRVVLGIKDPIRAIRYIRNRLTVN